MATYCTRYVPIPNCNLPMFNNDWNHVIPTLQMPFYTPHVPQMPFIVIKPTAMPAQLYPRVGNNITEYTTQTTQPLSIANYCEPVPSYSPELPTNIAIYKGIPHEVDVPTDNTLARKEVNSTDYVENGYDIYFNLPSELFPSASMFPIDPNPIIDEFCKQPNMVEHAAWIMDLELGIPRAPTTRLIPAYNVKYNSIQCKNTPTAVHPGFEICSEGFKRVLLFYYDCIISTWYRGYVIMKNDMSVENFQEWLLNPMQLYGMCWPKHIPSVL